MRTEADGSLLPLQHNDRAPDKYSATYLQLQEEDVPVGVEVPPMPEDRTAGCRSHTPVPNQTKHVMDVTGSTKRILWSLHREGVKWNSKRLP